MERSIDSLTFKGSIPEAIAEAKHKRKLFLVYISGEDENSVLLEQSTWKNVNLSESISRHCVSVHLLDGTVDASQFSAIYPQKSVPSISVIGYNGGKLLLNYEGYVSAESLASDIERTWASLHLQETTSTFLTAAGLASNKSDRSNSTASNVESALPSGSELEANGNVCEPSAEKCTIPIEETASQLVRTNDGFDEMRFLASVAANSSASRVVDVENSEVAARVLNAGYDSSATEMNSAFDAEKTSILPPSDELVMENEIKNGLEVVSSDNIRKKEMKPDGSEADLQDCVQDMNFDRPVWENADKIEDDVKTSDESISCADIPRSSDVHLNIRLPDGSSLQARFLMSDPLRLVKDHLRESAETVMGPYDLAIPYPRKVFNEQDMKKSLSELGFFNREALVVVPRNSVARSFRGSSSLHEHTGNTAASSDPSSENAEGLFGYLKRILSAVNVASYFRSGTNPDGEGPYNNHYSRSTDSSPTLDTSRDKKESTARFGSNIHTLKDDEGGVSGDRNTFWNGNSTQYGGDEK